MDVAQFASKIAVPDTRLSDYPAIECASLLPLASIAFSCSARFGLLTNAVNSTNYTAMNLESFVNNKLERIRKEVA
jgi:hypothetical protein